MGRAEDILEQIRRDGLNAIDEFILIKKSEELFLDFKTSGDNGTGRVLHKDDRANLEKAISGFANSEGGVIVWGISTKKDKYGVADLPSARQPISDVKKFISLLESAISGCTVPPHNKIENYPLVINDNNEGFVVTYIARSNDAPHMAVGDNRYYMRAGSSFKPVPHGVLAGMFGRRPQPHVYHNYQLALESLKNDKAEVAVKFMLYNDGMGIASDLFLNIFLASCGGSNCVTSYSFPKDDLWITTFSMGKQITVISKPDLRLPPGSFIEVVDMFLTIKPPFDDGIIINGRCGCGQSPAYKFQLANDATTVKYLYEKLMSKSADGVLTEEDRKKFVEDLLFKEEKLSAPQRIKQP